MKAVISKLGVPDFFVPLAVGVGSFISFVVLGPILLYQMSQSFIGCTGGVVPTWISQCDARIGFIYAWILGFISLVCLLLFFNSIKSLRSVDKR